MESVRAWLLTMTNCPLSPPTLDSMRRSSMTKLKLYDVIKGLLEKYPALRDSDRKLIWNVWGHMGFLSGISPNQYVNRGAFMLAPHFESIRRCRQKIQEKHPELRSSQTVMEAKIDKQHERGTFIYREPIQLGI
jgi:hypothetical protein